MLNVPELERRWQRYDKKRKTPYYIGIATASIVSIGVMLYLIIPADTNQHIVSSVSSAKPMLQTPTERLIEKSEITQDPNHNPEEKKQEIEASRSEPVPEHTATVMESAISSHAASAPAIVAAVVTEDRKTKEKKKEEKMAEKPIAPPEQTVIPTTSLQPSMEFMQDFEADVMEYYFEDDTTVEKTAVTEPSTSKPVPTAHSTQQVSQTTMHQPLAMKTEVAQHASTTNAPRQENVAKKPSMSISYRSNLKDIQDVIKRFKKNKKPALSLFVAKKYYSIGNYQQAYNYALITNELNSEIEDSWLIFAKALYKLDQREMAVSTLTTYIRESSSIKAKLLLDQMEKGTFE